VVRLHHAALSPPYAQAGKALDHRVREKVVWLCLPFALGVLLAIARTPDDPLATLRNAASRR